MVYGILGLIKLKKNITGAIILNIKCINKSISIFGPKRTIIRIHRTI